MFVTSDLDRWFALEILAHEAALTRYLQRVWQRHADVPDLRQEIYIRVYERAAKVLPASPKAFLFQTARNLIIDRARRERIVSIDYTQDLDALNVLIDEISPEQRLSARQELKGLAAALDGLSEDCRNVIWLRRVEGLSQKEAAARLGMPEGTLESHLCRGIRALMKVLLSGGTADDARENARGLGNESEHG
jgi:RNA polymerase sigma-70 factor (ECF subfamily)